MKGKTFIKQPINKSMIWIKHQKKKILKNWNNNKTIDMSVWNNMYTGTLNCFCLEGGVGVNIKGNSFCITECIVILMYWN